MNPRELPLWPRLVVVPAVAALAAAAACSPNATEEDRGGAFELDLADCLDPDAAEAEITDTITIGYSAALSGPVAGAVELNLAGFDARIEAENAAGGIAGMPIEVVYRDDAFQPDQARANVTEFLQRLDADVLSTFGAGSLGAMADEQNAACVPLLYSNSSDPEFFDLTAYPWTLQGLPAADKETRFLVEFIQDQVEGDPVVGVVANESASGAAQAEAFEQAAEEAGLEVAVVVDDSDPNAAAIDLQDAGVTVVYHGGVVGTCGVFDSARGRIGYEPELVLKASNCTDAQEYVAAGEASDGVVVAHYIKDPLAPEMADDAGVELYLSQAEDIPHASNNITMAGWLFADVLIDTLQRAHASDDGLTRASIIEAARDQDYASPLLTEGITWLSTPDRSAGVSGFEPVAWNAAEERFVPVGEVISVD